MPAAVEPERVVPSPPTVGFAVRNAATEFYFNSIRLVPANCIWGVVLVASLFLLISFPLIGALVLLLVLPLPTAGIFRLAVLIARGQPTALSDAFAVRAFLRPALAVGGSVVALSLVLGLNLVVGGLSAEPTGWAFATLAAWGLIAVWSLALGVWPLLLDPERDGQSIVATIRLAAAVALIRPARYAALMLLVFVLVVASTIMFAALLTITVAFVALLMSFYVLPLADHLESRRTVVIVA